jgi:DNA polymerase elongation subunit (family B)
VFLTVVERLVVRRLAAKAEARTKPQGSPERFQLEAVSAAIKLVVNSAYGYLGAAGLTRFSDVHAANDVTARGRQLLDFMCRELELRGVQLLEADTDGVYFAAPESFTEADEQRVVAEVAALLPPLVELQFDGRYAAMLSHEPKNYALLSHSGALLLRGVAFRSSRAEPFGEAFLKRAIARLLLADLPGVRAVYVETVLALRRRALPTFEVSSRVRLTKSPAEYAATRDQRRELPYEAMLDGGRDDWSAGERAHVYRRTLGRAGLWLEDSATDARDYDVEHYVRQLRENFASRLARGLSPDDYEAVVADPDQPSLFQRTLEGRRPILTPLIDAGEGATKGR